MSKKFFCDVCAELAKWLQIARYDAEIAEKGETDAPAFKQGHLAIEKEERLQL